MDPSDRFDPLPDDATCPACGASVPARSIRILARRDDTAFVELTCAQCGNAALDLLPAPAGPVSAADVEAIRADLADWDGDLVGWLERLRGDRRRSKVDR